ncbi:septum formation family protein [Nakamurella leprariae]|uniref:Septum formation family protein n=1 Tax=Nakamurella leprariae TaxID=2803911 RepID=A0A939BXV1_9ACTN|nr:septum formation family protein [Nakamurella leprariae]MBM9468938.1 septum formation family protein [Nakamurella leprariae]
MDRPRPSVLVALVAVIGLVLVAVTVLEPREDAVVEGRAVAEVIAAPPRVGDCVMGDVAASAQGLRSRALPELPVEPCTGPRDGEVVAVTDDYPAPIPSPDGPPMPGVEECHVEASAYLGFDRADAAPSDWAEWAVFGTELIGPDDRQAATGQTWAACVVFDITSEGYPSALSGSVRDVIRRLTPDTVRFAACLDRSGGAPVSCTRPHRVEIFRTATVPAEPGAAALDRACRDLVAAATSMPDPTAGGALTIAAGSDDRSVVSIEVGELVRSTDCSVTVTDPDRFLTTTLRHRGTAPLPLS